MLLFPENAAAGKAQRPTGRCVMTHFPCRSYFFFAAFALPVPQVLLAFPLFFDMHGAILLTPFRQPFLSPQASCLISREASIHLTRRDFEKRMRYPGANSPRLLARKSETTGTDT
jgi:hypothetical protein